MSIGGSMNWDIGGETEFTLRVVKLYADLATRRWQSPWWGSSSCTFDIVTSTPPRMNVLAAKLNTRAKLYMCVIPRPKAIG